MHNTSTRAGEGTNCKGAYRATPNLYLACGIREGMRSGTWRSSSETVSLLFVLDQACFVQETDAAGQWNRLLLLLDTIVLLCSSPVRTVFVWAFAGCDRMVCKLL